MCDSPEYFYGHVDELLAEMGAGEALGGAKATDLLRFVQAKGEGYALSRPEELRTVADVAAATGVILDAVYTGKALHALLQEMLADPEAWRGRKVLFLHTGGLLGLYDQAEQLQSHSVAAQRVHRMRMDGT